MSATSGPPETRRYTLAGWHGEVVEAWAPVDLEAEVLRLVDPSSALETVHWGRNYLYTAWLHLRHDRIQVVVKQFRNQGLARRLQRRLRGSKAARSWRVAGELLRVGLRTPEPVLLVEADDPEGPSLYVSRRLEGAVEVRHFFRRLAGEPEAQPFPAVDPERFLGQLGALARQLHDAGIWYRDLSLGNVLAREEGSDAPALYLVDFNRARIGRRLGAVRRTRDICRFPVLRQAHREAFLQGYWGEVPPRWSVRWWLYVASVRAYILKHQLKNRVRRRRSGGRPRGAGHHAHIPPASPGSSVRDRAVWDRLSDQPHQHAGRLAKMGIRLTDAPGHARDLLVASTSLPRAWSRYRDLRRGLYAVPSGMAGMGLAVRPWGLDPGPQAEAIAELGVRHVLIRLHPWDRDHVAEDRLCAALVERGVDLAFALPQDRDLVRDPARWRGAVEELGERFARWGRWFQVGQAVNRSKWGVWTRREYLELFSSAAQVLRHNPGVRLAGPAVIDFEFQFILALVNCAEDDVHFDAVSSLLYVDRRGAPENRQLGFDTVDKVALLRAIADTGRRCSPRCWITEFNWPLWEGPHSPAGRSVAVDEETQADYLVRYFILALGTGLVERAYWWRLLARGYGLMTDDGGDLLRRRPSFLAMRTLVEVLAGAQRVGPPRREDGVVLYRFREDGREIVAGWSVDGRREAELPRPALEARSRDGASLPVTDGTQAELTPSPRYFLLD